MLERYGVPRGHFIGGSWREGQAGLEVFSPIDEAPLGQIAEGTEAEVADAATAAADAFPAWAALGARGRAPYLERFAAAQALEPMPSRKLKP